jgi:hypothetical protein
MDMRLGLVVLGIASALFASGVSGPATLLIDDFSRDGLSAIGQTWQTFTDRVMGGLSDGRAGFETLDGKRCLRLQGNVSLENQGGFVQAALPLAKAGDSFDASGFKGVRIWVRGNGAAYYLHLRTADNRLPWQYYEAGFETGRTWQQVDIPFADFKPENLGQALDKRNLKRLAIVAAKRAFTADVAVARIEFYE